MLSAGPRPLNDFVFDTITDILTASEIIRRDHASDERGNSGLLTAKLEKVFAFSDSLWEKVRSLPPSSVPSLHEHLVNYGIILVDIQHILSSSDPVVIDSLAIGFRLDDFLLQFKKTLDLLKGPTDQPDTLNSTNNVLISGGTFNFISNPVDHDLEQSRKLEILQVLYIQCVVLFS